jgi:zinc protease
MPSPKLIALCGVCVLLLGSLPLSVGAQNQARAQAPAPAATTPTPYSEVRRDSLLNGLQIVTLERPSEVQLRCEIVIRAGAMFDFLGKIGLAGLTQEALLAANPRLTQELESLQARIEWGVNWDVTWFRLEAPPGGFDTAMEILGRLLVVETIRPDQFKQAHETQLARLKEQAANLSPAARADAAFLATLYGNHPYGHGIAGTEQTLATIHRGDVIDFYKRFYIANDAVAIVLGNVKHERIMRTFKSVLGGWAKGALVPASFRQPQRATTVRLNRVELPEAPGVELRAGVIGLKYIDADFLATQVLARALERKLQQEGAAFAASGITVRAVPRFLPGPLLMSASVPAERAAEFSRRATDSFAALATTPAMDEELAAAKASLIQEHAARPIFEHLREMEVYGLPRNHALTYAARVNALTAANLQRVAKQLLDNNALTVVVLGRISEHLKSSL